MDTGTPVTLADFHYAVPFRFTGSLNKLTIDLQPQQQITAAEQAETAVKARRNNRASR